MPPHNYLGNREIHGSSDALTPRESRDSKLPTQETSSHTQSKQPKLPSPSPSLSSFYSSLAPAPGLSFIQLQATLSPSAHYSPQLAHLRPAPLPFPSRPAKATRRLWLMLSPCPLPSSKQPCSPQDCFQGSAWTLLLHAGHFCLYFSKTVKNIPQCSFSSTRLSSHVLVSILLFI